MNFYIWYFIHLTLGMIAIKQKRLETLSPNPSIPISSNSFPVISPTLIVKKSNKSVYRDYEVSVTTQYPASYTKPIRIPVTEHEKMTKSVDRIVFGNGEEKTERKVYTIHNSLVKSVNFNNDVPEYVLAF